MTDVLDAAQIVGLSAADQALAMAIQNVNQAKAQQVRVYAAVGLDPEKRYSISAEGEVHEIADGP